METTLSRDLDRQAFAAVERVWAATGVGNPARGDTFEAVQDSLAHGGVFLTVRAPSGIVATAWLTDDGRRLYLHHMAVLPEEQGKGHARRLLDEVLAIARERRRQVKLEVHRENARARTLYERYGFQPLTGYDPFILRKP